MMHIPNWTEAFAEASAHAAGDDGSNEQTINSLVTVPSVYGTVFTILCFVFFGLAVHNEWNFDLAPRISNRPKKILKSAMTINTHRRRRIKRERLSESVRRSVSASESESRVNVKLNKNIHWWWYYPMVFIDWAYHLTYHECLQGISGTGTRIRLNGNGNNNGKINNAKGNVSFSSSSSSSSSSDSFNWEGPMLKTNLDAVIFLRFHALLFKLSAVVFVLCTTIILPINLTAECDPKVFGVGTCDQRAANSTGFLRTTITNIPDKIYNNNSNVVVLAAFDPSNIVNAFNHKNYPNEKLMIEYDHDDNKTALTDNLASMIDNDDETTTTATNYTAFNYNTNTTATFNINTTNGMKLRRTYHRNKNKKKQNASDAVQFMSAKLWVPNQTWRVVATLLSCIVMYVYTYYLLANEWIANVELRRKYFLEANHYTRRMKELNQLVAVCSSSSSSSSSSSDDCFCIDDDNDIETKIHSKNDLVNYYNGDDDGRNRNNTNNNNNNNTNNSNKDEESLPPYLTHPEIRESPPDVGIYSVMYQLPESMVTYDTDGATPIKRQLVATTNFFDEIIPPQPGFSSSVVAATVLPNAKLVAKAWNKWVSCESKLRALRYIRKLIAAKKAAINTSKTSEMWEEERRIYNTYSSEDEMSNLITQRDNGSDVGRNKNSYDSTVSQQNDRCDIDGSSNAGGSSVMRSTERKNNGNLLTLMGSDENEPPSSPIRPPKRDSNNNKNNLFRYSRFNVQKYAKSLGFCDEVDLMTDFVNGMGIEEFHVFALQCSYIAGGLGLDLMMFDLYDVDQLTEKETEIILALREAQRALQRARSAVVSDNHGDHAILTERGVSVRSAVYTAADFKNLAISSYDEDEDSYDVRSLTSADDSNSTTDDSVASNGHNNHTAAAAAGTAAAAVTTTTGYTGTSIPGCIEFHWRRIFHETVNLTDFGQKYYGRGHIPNRNIGKGFVTDLEYPTYAVVTFSSRQSAIIARQCLADGGGKNIWKPVDGIPNYPLADSPSLKFYPRGCMRPVTPTIRYSSKKIRRWLMVSTMIVFTVANVYIVQKINKFVLNPELFSKVFGVSMETATKYTSTASGLSQSLLFSICPAIFKFVAYCEGSSNSLEMAERRAMIYFWYFYLIARFMGQILWQAVLSFLSGRSSAEKSINKAITDLANTVPNSLGPSALSFIISSGTISFPLFYFIQICNFGTAMMSWVNRYFKAGGNGCEVPYRIYVDSGYIFACMIALGPLCPLVGTFGMCYFIIIAPMVRFTVVFAYRPVFEGGGDKWPKLHHIIITSLLLSQLITSVTFILKQNVVEGLIAGCCIIPTLVFNNIIQEKYLRPYRDAGLLQTGRLLNDDTRAGSSSNRYNCEEREEYRRWLVDCHKASYVPTCLSGGSKNLLTAEPAVTIADDETAEC